MCGKSIQNSVVGIYGMGKIGRLKINFLLNFKDEIWPKKFKHSNQQKFYIIIEIN